MLCTMHFALCYTVGKVCYICSEESVQCSPNSVLFSAMVCKMRANKCKLCAMQFMYCAQCTDQERVCYAVWKVWNSVLCSSSIVLCSALIRMICGWFGARGLSFPLWTTFRTLPAPFRTNFRTFQTFQWFLANFLNISCNFANIGGKLFAQEDYPPPAPLFVPCQLRLCPTFEHFNQTFQWFLANF